MICIALNEIHTCHHNTVVQMSVILKLDNIPTAFVQKLDAYLEVRSTPPQRFPQTVAERMRTQATYQLTQKLVRAYDVFDVASASSHEGGGTGGTTRYVCLPFSFYYHHCSSIPRIKLPTHTQRQIPFVGQLLPRQSAIEAEAIEILNRSGSVLLCLHTGFGKTIFTLYLLSRIGMKALVLCHRAIIIQQWLESAARYLPTLKCEVLSTADVKRTGADTYADADILVANALLIPKCPRKLYAQFGCVIIDEVHTICTEQFSKALFQLTPSYLIGLSATPFRSDGMDRLLELYIGPEMIIRKMTRYFNAYKLDTGFEPEVEETFDGKLNWNAVLESQSTSVERNLLLVKLVWYFVSRRTILVLVKRKEHARELKEKLLTLNIDVDCFMGGTKNVNYDCRVLIATYSKGGVGFDHPKLDMLIAGADVEENFMQYLGRVFRRDDQLPIYIDLRDNMTVMTKHSQTRLRICKEVGGVVRDFHKTFRSFTSLTEWIT